jgi:hypothetical protein
MKSTKKVAKKVKPKDLSSEYYVSVRLGDKSFEGAGSTLEDALASLPQKLKIVSKGFVAVSHEGKTTEKMYQSTGIKRLFFPMARHVVAKELTFLLK